MTAGVAPTWSWKRFEDLAGSDVYDVLALRGAAFVVEQRCTFLDPDGVDRSAWHLLGHEPGGTLVAYLRCLDADVRDPEPSIGRVVVAVEARGTGLGRVLMDEGIVRSQHAWPGACLVVNAQLRLAPFYRSLGFAADGAPYVEDDIDHLRMRRPAALPERQENGR